MHSSYPAGIKKKQYIHNAHYTDKFQLNVLVTHNTFMYKHPLCDVLNLNMVELLHCCVHVYIPTKKIYVAIKLIIIQLCSCLYSY